MSTEKLLEERGKIHGDFEEDATLAQRLKNLLRSSNGWERLSFVQQEALDHICTKTARILAGDPNHKDHWDDIAGYATLVSQRLQP